MGKYDDAMYRYLSDNDRFADLFNAVLFGGTQVLKGELLEPASERHVETVTGSRFRDIKKRVKTGESFVVTAIENQEVIDYTMPWRIMQYDQMAYGEQIRDIRRRKEAVLREQGKPLRDWVTRLGPEDRLRPVYTICFYHGMKIWDGPRSLEDMMAFEETDDAKLWRQSFHNYGMTLFCASEAGDLSSFGTELRQLLEALALRKDRSGLERLWRRKDFSRLDRETAETMAIMTDSAKILEKLEDYEEEGGYNMCLAVDEMRRDWKAEGREEGRAEAENRMQELIKCMLAGGEQDQLHRLSERAFLEQMYLKYSI